MLIDAMQKELLIRMSLFLRNKDHGQLGCTAKPFKNLDIEKALCSESVTIDHSLLMKIRRYHNEIKETTANETSSSLASIEQDNDDCNTDYYQSKKPKKTNNPNAEQQEKESNATPIKELIITYNAAKHLTNDDLEKLAKLGFIHEKTEVINLKFCRQITDLSPLASYVALKDLYLSYCDQITNLSPLASCTALTSLGLSLCNQITDLSPLASCTALTSLGLSLCNQITDLSPLASCTSLTNLDLRSCTSIRNLSPLINHPTLSNLIDRNGEKVDLASLSNTQRLYPLNICLLS